MGDITPPAAMIGYLKVNHLKGCHTQTPWIASLAKVAVENAELLAVDYDPRWSEARDATGLSMVTCTFHTGILRRNTVLPFFLLYYAWQIPI